MGKNVISFVKNMWTTVIVIWLCAVGNLVVVNGNNEEYCHASSMSDFVQDSLVQVCFQSDSVGRLNYSMNEAGFYHAHCRIYHEIKQCLDNQLKACEEIRPGFHQHVLNLVESYQLPLEYFDYDPKIYDSNHYLQNLIPFCDGEKLSNHFSQQFDRSLLNCITQVTLNKHKQCLATFKNNIQTILETKTALSEITKWSEDFLRCIYNSIPTTCPTATKEVFIFRESLAVPEKRQNVNTTSLNITKIVKQKLPSQNVKGYAQSKRATSSIHGDPHLMQLHTSKAVTCKLLQNQTYIFNPYFKITGVSKHVGDPDLTATAIYSLQIDFFDSNGQLIAYYRALNGKLPFELIHLDSSSPSTVHIDHGEQHSNEGHVTLTHLPSSTQIIVNRWSKFYYFLVRSSEFLLNNSNGYLITGCPQNEIIDRQAIIARLKERFARSQRKIVVLPARQRRSNSLRESDIPDQCEQICSTDDNAFPDECLFDCLALAVSNASQAFQVDQMHRTVTRECRQLADNDQRIVKEFQACYKKGLICKTMPTDSASIQSFSSSSLLIFICTLLFLIK